MRVADSWMPSKEPYPTPGWDCAHYILHHKFTSPVKDSFISDADNVSCTHIRYIHTPTILFMSWPGISPSYCFLFKNTWSQEARTWKKRRRALSFKLEWHLQENLPLKTVLVWSKMVMSPSSLDMTIETTTKSSTKLRLNILHTQALPSSELCLMDSMHYQVSLSLSHY